MRIVSPDPVSACNVSRAVLFKGSGRLFRGAVPWQTAFYLNPAVVSHQSGKAPPATVEHQPEGRDCRNAQRSSA
jgi:hypothetical protein